MAIKLLAKKGDKERLRENWHLKFFSYYFNLQFKFILLRDYKRYYAKKLKIIKYQLKLYNKIKCKYKVNNNNIYNFNKKGIMQKVARKLEIIILKTKKNLYYIYLKKRE